ncbi:MAG TPA: type IV pilus secretin PilQ [Thermoanaerobaculia bacterium]|nr:type IV pilus secretin PilQ [Thermoanaerobaculia bacterium]
MRRTSRSAATAIAMAAIFAGAFGCSGVKKGSRVSAGAPGSTAAASPAAPASVAADAPGRVTRAAFNEDADGARIVLTADVPLLYTSYQPRPDLLYIEMNGVQVSEGFAPPVPSGALVQSMKIETIEEMGKRFTRLTVAHRPGLKYDVRSLGQGLAVAFEGDKVAVAEPEPSPAPAPVVAEPLAPPVLVRAERAQALEEVTAETVGDGVAVHLLADGQIQATDFLLANPPRLVIDLPGVKNSVRRRVVPVAGGLVTRVRVSQFQSTPDPITRIVLDLARSSPYTVRADGERLSVLVGGLASPTASASPDAVPVEEPVVVAEVPAPARAEPPAPRPAASRTEITAPETVVPAPPRAAPAEPVPAQPERVAPAPAAVNAPPSDPPAPLPPGIREARRTRPKEPSPKVAAPAPSREDALFEAAAAVLAQQEGAARAGELTAFQSRTLAEGQSQFTGEPISLDLKDADIKDVFRTISQLTGLNIVIDPEVRGTVTVQLENVPWDQALDLILKQNGLGYVLENNIMRIATTAKLQTEESDRARLAEARQAAEPTRTVIKKLSYARAVEITPTLKSIMSRRGDIVVDARTNTLIIREIPTFLPAVLQLIENLDTSTPQVMIESRIVETTKTLGRSLGINWGFSGVADVAHGNTTNLVFPNNVDGGFRVGLENGPVIGAIRLGNILDTFNLDISLTAAENQGLLKIISSPKLAALTNTAALIQSGVQIPVQTTVNNTTTVIYVDATLRLEVTPQITAEGTILLNVNVQKREPAVALNLALGQNVPLTIREYRGQVLVRDGGTTVIGGIFQINDQDQNNMIPGLWKIPILGNLFRNKTRTEKHDELLIFITPRILR